MQDTSCDLKGKLRVMKAALNIIPKLELNKQQKCAALQASEHSDLWHSVHRFAPC